MPSFGQVLKPAAAHGEFCRFQPHVNDCPALVKISRLSWPAVDALMSKQISAEVTGLVWCACWPSRCVQWFLLPQQACTVKIRLLKGRSISAAPQNGGPVRLPGAMAQLCGCGPVKRLHPFAHLSRTLILAGCANCNLL